MGNGQLQPNWWHQQQNQAPRQKQPLALEGGPLALEDKAGAATAGAGAPKPPDATASAGAVVKPPGPEASPTAVGALQKAQAAMAKKRQL